MKNFRAKKIPLETVIHGEKRVDYYDWMRLTDKQKNSKIKDSNTKEVLEYINVENEYLNKELSSTKKIQKKLFKEMVGKIKKDDSSVPYEYNGYWYALQYKRGKEYPIYYRMKKNIKSKKEVLLDVNKLSDGNDYYDLLFDADLVSPNNKWLLFCVDNIGRRNYDVFFKNIESGEILSYKIEDCDSEPVWCNDSETIFYLRKNKTTLIGEKLYKHIIGTDPSRDLLIFHEKDQSYDNYIYKTKSNKYIILGHHSTLSTDFQLLDANNPNGKFKRFSPRLKKHQYIIGHAKDKFYMVTNWNAKNFRLMETSENETNRKFWKEIIPHRKNVLLDYNFSCFDDYLVMTERIKGLSNIRIINLKNNDSHYVKFEEPAYNASISDKNLSFNTDYLRFNYSSLITPNTQFRYNMRTKTKKILKQLEVIGGYDKNKYVSERIYVKSRDDKKIPVSLVYNKSKFKKPGKILLYGYGSYGLIVEPTFSISRLSLLDRGFCFAIAHVRGSKVYDEKWYEDGKLLNKKNTFNDFIDCALHLINHKYTITKNLYASGGSAGGLLIGAVMNMNGNLFNGMIAGVPFVDVINTMLDDSIPLTTFEYDEWGNPNMKKYFKYMLSYSPYDNIQKKTYPNLLVTSGYYDSQVQYWEPLKWVAKLREYKTDDNLLLLDMDMDAGHGGTTGRFKVYKKIALEYAFLFYLEGIND